MGKRAKRSPIWKISKEEFSEVIRTNSTISDMLKYFGLKNIGGNYKTLKRRVEEEGLDLTHVVLGIGSNKGNNRSKGGIPLSEILVENSTYNRGHLKKRIVKENVLEYKCAECGIASEWNGKKLVLTLDHKNGINDDNRVENLRFLCPNCHSQTDTFAGKNFNKPQSEYKSAKVKCKNCNTMISPYNKTKMCHKCSSASRRKTKDSAPRDIRLILEQISELGYRGTGRLYGVSDNAIRKWLKKAE